MQVPVYSLYRPLLKWNYAEAREMDYTYIV